MKIQDQSVVTMTYVLRENDENGPILQETTKENPFVAIFGMHQLLPKFEENLMGKEPGDKYAFHLTPEEGYGERDEAYVMDLDKNMFMKNNVLMDMVKVHEKQRVNGYGESRCPADDADLRRSTDCRCRPCNWRYHRDDGLQP